MFLNCKVRSGNESRSYFPVFTLTQWLFFLLTMWFRVTETKQCCSEKGRKNIDQLQGEFKGSVLIWNNVCSQVSSVALLWLHWWCRAFSYFTLTVCMCGLKCASPQTISWWMNIECWHFFETECQFSEHSKKTQKWVSVCGHVPFASLLKRVCLASAKLKMQGTNNRHHC